MRQSVAGSPVGDPCLQAVSAAASQLRAACVSALIPWSCIQNLIAVQFGPTEHLGSDTLGHSLLSGPLNLLPAIWLVVQAEHGPCAESLMPSSSKAEVHQKLRVQLF